MSAVAVLFIAVGVADACRRLTRAGLALIAGPVIVVACATLAGLWNLGDIALLALAAAASTGWVWLCSRTERRWWCSA
jgi:hypothetical protein